MWKAYIRRVDDAYGVILEGEAEAIKHETSRQWKEAANIRGKENEERDNVIKAA
ncbi:hypothetical protein AGMMS49592_6300 [Endomicrobiia bacterium]|nr:hypothetical protein AGMMS49592_6300 [Endomicrobiia bacterium]